MTCASATSLLRGNIYIYKYVYSIKLALLLTKILGHLGELLEEYRALGELLETGSGTGQEAATLTERQRLLLQRFETARESFLRSYRNVVKDQPYETAAYYVRQVFFCRKI